MAKMKAIQVTVPGTEFKPVNIDIPEYMEFGFACKLGYPVSETKYLRVRRDIGSFTHHNKYGEKWLA